MMDRDTNIFYRITSKDEDTTSELLCNILRTKYFRDIFFEFMGIPSKVYETISFENITTQASLDGIGRPDLVIENKNSLYFIENKIHASTHLQESQVTTYLKYINTKNKDYKGCIFLIPNDYEHESKINDEAKLFPFVSIRYWQDLLNYLNKKEVANESPVIGEVLEYFSTLILKNSVETTKLNLQEVIIMYNPKDLYNSLKFVEKVKNLIKNVEERIVEKLGENFSIGKDQYDLGGRGRYLNYNNYNNGPIFIGLNPGVYDKQNGECMFSVALYKNVLKENVNIDKDKYTYCSDEECIYVSIDRKVLASECQESDLTDLVVDIIKNVFLKNVK